MHSRAKPGVSHEMVGPPLTKQTAEEDLQALVSALHALTQPVTALMCRLELGSMNGTLEGYREAVAESLRECHRLTESVGVMRELITRALERK